MLNDNAKAWVEALRSGEFSQGMGQLRVIDVDGDAHHCCLGVGCELYAVRVGGEWQVDTFVAAEGDEDDVALPHAVQKWLGLQDENGDIPATRSLAAENDRGTSFDEIANIIESEPEGLFA